MACVNGFCTNQGCDNCTTKHVAACGGNATAWSTDPTITAGATLIKAAHVNEMRSALDSERSRRGQTNCGIGGWSTVTAGVDEAEAQKMTDLKTCNNGLTYYPGDGDVLTSISDTYSIGALILAADVTNMRSAINQNEVRCVCNTDCGADNCFCTCFGDCGCNYP